LCDPVSYGTLCAVVAAGTRAAGGWFEGVAPDAGIIACRTRSFDSELTAIYDHLIAMVERDSSLRLITTNSFGRRCGLPPPPVEGDFPAALEEAIGGGIAVFFSAGNNHDLAGGGPADCHPTTIWHYKGRADVFTVGTSDLEGRLWEYSSRGTAAKPDLVAPTPRGGLVAFGGEDRSFPEGWGTSGACPQATGLAAILWTEEPSLTAAELFGRIRAGARDLGLAWNCQGAGQLDCYWSLAGGARMETRGDVDEAREDQVSDGRDISRGSRLAERSGSGLRAERRAAGSGGRGDSEPPARRPRPTRVDLGEDERYDAETERAVDGRAAGLRSAKVT
jgi:hypothetical protein